METNPHAVPLPDSDSESDSDSVASIQDLPIEIEPENEVSDEVLLRLGLLTRIRESFRDSTNKRSLIFKFIMSVGQIILYTVLLGLGASQNCQKLRVYLILTTIRISLSLPLSIYALLVPPIIHRRSTQESIDAAEARRRIGSKRTDIRLRKLSDLLSLAAMILFVYGNIYLFSSGNCRNSSPFIFWGTVVSISISYLYILEVVFIILAVLFFLPLTLLLMRYLGMGEKKNQHKALTLQTISKIPLVIYAPSPPLTAESISTGYPPLQASQSKESIIKPKKVSILIQLLNNLLKKKSNIAASSSFSGSSTVIPSLTQEYATPPYPYVTLPENLSTCSICLSDYEAPPLKSNPDPQFELLRKLSKCNHIFHQECLDSWLVVSGRCPVCSVPVIDEGKKNRV